MPTNLPKNLADLLAETPLVTAVQVERMKALAEEADRDPRERAEFEKAAFVNSVLNAMHSENLTKSELAKRINLSRQYVTQLLDAEEPANFTIDTMSIVSTAVNRRVKVLVLEEDEEVNVTKRAKPRSALETASAHVQKIISEGAQQDWYSLITEDKAPQNIVPFSPAWDEKSFRYVLKSKTIKRANDPIALIA